MRLGIPRIKHARTVAEIVGAVLLLSAGAASAAAMTPAASPPAVIHACVAPADAYEFHLRTGPTCPAGERAISWNETGPAGTTGIFGRNTNKATTSNGYGNTCTTGQVELIAGREFEDTGLAPADGQLLPIGPYPGLFSVLGTEYGGNGKTTFRVPNLEKAAPDGLTYAICTNEYNNSSRTAATARGQSR